MIEMTRRRFARPSADRTCASIQAIHRVRSRLVGDRVRLVNQIRGLLGEHGVVIAQAIGNLRRELPRIIDEQANGLTSIIRALIGELREELNDLDKRIGIYDRKVTELYRASEACQRLGKVEGIGPITATALVAASLAMESPSKTDENPRHGSVLSQDNDRAAAGRGCSALANAEIAIFARCLSMALAPR